MDNEKPGAPSEPEKPKEVGESVYFALSHLQLMRVEDINGVLYLHFLVGDGEYIVVIREFEYYAYQSYIYRELSILMDEGASCTCDNCTPTFEKIGVHEIQRIDINIDSGEEIKGTEKTKETNVYLVTNLVESTRVGIHDDEEEHIK